MRVGNAAASTDINAQRQIGINQSNLAKSLERLSSGMRINKAADDAAGLAVSETIRTQIRGLAQGSANSEDGLNLLNTADGGLQEMQNMLHRVRELVVQGANETYTDSDREKIQGEISQLLKHVDEVSYNTEFNGIKVLRGGSAVKGGAIGYITTPVLSPTIPGMAGSPTVPYTPTIPAVVIPMVATVESNAAVLYKSIGTQVAGGPNLSDIQANSLTGIGVDAAGNIYVGDGDPPSTASLPSPAPHAVIKIDNLGNIDTNYAVTANSVITGVAVNKATGDVYVAGNNGANASVELIPAGSPSGTSTTAIFNDPQMPPGPNTLFNAGVAINPTDGSVNVGTASPLFGGPFANVSFAGIPIGPSSNNNIWKITGATTANPVLGEPGTITGVLTGSGFDAGLHNNKLYPNNANEQTGAAGSTTPGINKFDGNNVFIQDFSFDSSGTVYFSSRMTAPLEFKKSAGLPGPLAPLPAAGELFAAVPQPGGGTIITKIDLATIPITSGPAPATLPITRYGGIMVGPSGDLFVSDRDNNMVWRIKNPGTPGQTATTITTLNEPVVGMAYDPAGNVYMSTLSGTNDVLKLSADTPMVPTIIVSPTVAMVATIPMGVATPTVAATFGPSEFVALDGSLHIQTGANEAQDIRIKVNDMSAAGLNLEGMDVTRWGSNPYGTASTDQYVEDINYDLRRIDDALANISTVRATFGAYYNRLEHSKANVDNARENQASSESRIRDTDMAKETSEMVRQQILSQASTGMLGQIQRINGQLVMGLIQGTGR